MQARPVDRALSRRLGLAQLQGVEIASLADRPELWRAAYDAVALDAFADLPVPSRAVVTRD